LIAEDFNGQEAAPNKRKGIKAYRVALLQKKPTRRVKRGKE